jgi:hypothetical protein
MCRPEHAYAAQMHARLKLAMPASRLARVNCSIVVSPINIIYIILYIPCYVVFARYELGMDIVHI